MPVTRSELARPAVRDEVVRAAFALVDLQLRLWADEGHEHVGAALRLRPAQLNGAEADLVARAYRADGYDVRCSWVPDGPFLERVMHVTGRVGRGAGEGGGRDGGDGRPRRPRAARGKKAAAR